MGDVSERSMASFRRFWMRNAPFAALLLVLALAIKALLPQGYMVAAESRSFEVMLCAGLGKTATVTIPFDGHGAEADKAEALQCHGMLADKLVGGGTDPLLLPAALAFILALGFVPTIPPLLERLRFFQPPLRAPPSFA